MEKTQSGRKTAVELLSPALVHKFMNWKHSGFNLFHGDAVPGTHRAELEDLAQYILRHSFSVEKITYLPQSSRVIYHSRMNQSTRRNFEVFTALDFLAAATQHIPEKGAQIVKYYGWYSNKSRGQRAKLAGRARPPGGPVDPNLAVQSEIDNRQSKIPSKIPTRTWRELIKKVWGSDPLLCPKGSGQMRLIALIEDNQAIDDILRHLDLWEQPSHPTGLAPPAGGVPPLRAPTDSPEPFRLEVTYEPFYDDVPFGPGSFAE